MQHTQQAGFVGVGRTGMTHDRQVEVRSNGLIPMLCFFLDSASNQHLCSSSPRSFACVSLRLVAPLGANTLP